MVCEPTDAGTANLYGLDLPADEANQAMRRINRMARKLKAKGDKRPIDLIRAELFLVLLNGRNEQINGSDADRAQVNLHAELTTVLGLDEQPGEIPGFGPVISDVVRKIVANQPQADWNFGITHHDQLLDVITTRRRPTKAQKQAVQALEPDCVWLTCRMPFADCDINHEIPWVDGHHTTGRELGPLCRHHHVNHHRRGWTLKRTRLGSYQWTSPLGHTYTTGPDPP